MRRQRAVSAAAAIVPLAIAFAGCDGGSAKGIVLSPPPPFSIPTAPMAGELQPCDTRTRVLPLGFLADGRVVVGQDVSSLSTIASLILAWNPATNELEKLFEMPGRLPDAHDGRQVHVSRNGKRIFDVDPSPATSETFKVYDRDVGGFLPGVPVPGVIAVSESGDFVLDNDLRSYTAFGELVFDFRSVIPAEFIPHHVVVGVSSAGDGVIAIGGTSIFGSVAAVVVYRDGRVFPLPDPPNFETYPVSGGVAWSADDRHVLAFADRRLRIWSAETGAVLASIDAGISSAAFLPESDGVVTANPEGQIVDRDLSGQPGLLRRVVAPYALDLGGRIVGVAKDDRFAITVANRGGVEGRWYEPQGWMGGRAVSADAMFKMVSVTDVMLARFAPSRANPTAVFSSGESQSEWEGAVVLSPDERRVAAVFPDTIAILDAPTLALLATIPSGSGRIAWSPDGRYLAATPDLHYRDPSRPSYTPRKEVVVWDSASGKVAARFETPVFADDVAFDQAGARLVGFGYPIVNASMAREGTRASFGIDLPTGASSASDLPPFVGATRELIASANSIVRISTGQEVRVSSLSGPSLTSATFSGDFSVMGAVDEDLTFHLFGVSDGHAVSVGPVVGPRPLPALSRDGRRVVLGDVVYCLTDRP